MSVPTPRTIPMTNLSRAGDAPFTADESLFSLPSSLRSTWSLQQPAQAPVGSTIPPDLVLPAVYQDHKRKLKKIAHKDQAELDAYFKWNLNVDSLIEIHKHLWLAGLPHGPRALHAQLLIGREICITEKADLHLLWQGDKVYLKPLPDYLMCHAIWDHVLCKKLSLYEEANGFLFSYLWMICDQSDFKIARDAGLISEQLDWARWARFSQSAAAKLDPATLAGISPRYLYGDLRLGRVNNILRFCSRTTSFSILMRGHIYRYHDYSTFIQRNFAWFLTFVVYIGLVLTAMQVGLGTNELRDSVAFNRASYGFTVFSILAPLIILASGALVLLVLIFFNARYALTRRRKASKEHESLFMGLKLKQHQH